MLNWEEWEAQQETQEEAYLSYCIFDDEEEDD